MNERRWERLGAQAGIAFIVLVMIGIFLPGKPPDQNASGATLIKFIADHRDALRWSVGIFSVSTVCALFFFATLRARLSEAEGGHNELATAAVVGGVFLVLANMMGGAFWAVSFVREGNPLSASTVRWMWDANNVAGMFGNVGLAVVLGSVAAVVLSTGLLPRWVGWLSTVVAAACVVSLFGMVSPTGAFGPGGSIQLLTTFAGFISVLAISVELLMHAEAPVPASAGAAAAMTA
jgi:hypothetical protein